MTSTTILGLVAAACTTIALLPQTIRSLKTHHMKDVSLWMYVIFTIGLALWLTYGFMIHDLPLLLANGISFIFAIITLALKIRYK